MSKTPEEWEPYKEGNPPAPGETMKIVFPVSMILKGISGDGITPLESPIVLTIGDHTYTFREEGEFSIPLLISAFTEIEVARGTFLQAIIGCL
jgi:hypothetical protein